MGARSGGDLPSAGPAVLLALTLATAGCTSPGPQAPSAVTPPPPATRTSAQPRASATAPVDAEAPPPYVARVRWVRASGGRSLHVYPTPAGRAVHGDLAAAEAWSEVIRLAPDANQPGMRAQFQCHWSYARLVEPAKPSWNLEPWRPVVTAEQMAQAGCNPGGPEDADG